MVAWSRTYREPKAKAAPAGLTCAFGAPWSPTGPPCPACRAFVALLRAEFARAVLAGEMDPQGYTSAERRTQAQKRVSHP